MKSNRMRRWLERRGPYQSLLILAVPLAVVEPAKLVALGVVGNGHWLTGLTVMIAAYAISVFFIHRLFFIVKPKLLTLRWFKNLWREFTRLRAKALSPFMK
jgi:hypothetical protein